ncbi:MAG: DOMON domain-containing protein [Dehalogenimonas sp.]|jgi:hypothetical protein|uniref:DOMON domain-containing protein n=1 Tax=Candidatus Dehalogenimonas loeffleri TaxID=3127115 RepID=A0ABZ2J2J4_9CHLR|nr:DOMON domain-containing protein [Dehalogenimonas sp.]
MGGEVLVLGIIAMGTWLIPFFGLPVPIIGLVWGIMILRRRPAKKGMTISGVILSSIGLFLAVSYTIITVIGGQPDIINLNPGGDSNLPPPGPVDWEADGDISAGEYENYLSLGSGLQIYWKNDGQFIYAGVQATTEGWVSVGFIDALRSGPKDLIIGYTDDTGVGHIYDRWAATQPGGSFQDDEQLGGQKSLLEWAVAYVPPVEEEEEVAFTVMEFRRRLNTGDAYDLQLLTGPNLFTWAYGYSDDINTGAAESGYGVLEIK